MGDLVREGWRRKKSLWVLWMEKGDLFRSIFIRIFSFEGDLSRMNVTISFNFLDFLGKNFILLKEYDKLNLFIA